jgi:hypothetical protein
MMDKGQKGSNSLAYFLIVRLTALDYLYLLTYLSLRTCLCILEQRCPRSQISVKKEVNKP